MLRRIAILGCGGAGKSTLARDLGALLGLPALHLDELYWMPGWIERDLDGFRELQRQWVSRESWVIDGNYASTFDLRLERADTFVFLDLPRSTCLSRVVRRYLRFRGTTRPGIAADCPERLGWDFVAYIWSYPRTHRPRALAAMEQAAAGGIATHHLRSPAEVQAFVDGLRVA